MIPIPIPTNQALIPILIPESDSGSRIIYNSDMHHNPLAMCIAYDTLWIEKGMQLLYMYALWILNIPNPHVSPVNPDVQVHVCLLTPSTHCPTFKHGSGSHSSALLPQTLPS